MGDEDPRASAETQGLSILKLGLFDLAVSEMIWRLTDPGETALDVGANIGHMTGVMMTRVGAGGTVHAVEPHPGLFGELSHNVAQWRKACPHTRVHLHQVAMSERSGSMTLVIPDDFAHNRGLATLDDSTELASPTADAVPVTAQTLDELVGGATIGMAKIDVEGHELSVLKGAARTLADGRIRDCVFEEHRPYPTDVTECLRQHGFELFRLMKRIRGPVLMRAFSAVEESDWESCSYLATRDADRAINRFSQRGWTCLRASRRIA